MLNKEEITILIQVLNQPRQQDLQTAGALIQLSNKLSQMLGELDLPPKTAKQERDAK